MPGTSKTLFSWTATVAALGVALCLAMACTARAADRIYWVNEETATAPSIGHANLAGGGGGEVPVPGIPSLFGLGIDPVAGKFYSSGGVIAPLLSANLDGTGLARLDTTGAPLPDFSWFAIDPAGGRAYVTNDEPASLSFVNLRGGGGGPLNTAGVTPRDAGPVAVHPAAGKIYWANGNTIAFANLAGGGGGTLDLAIQAGVIVNGLAIDASAERIFWIEVNERDALNPFRLRFASLRGGPIGELDLGESVIPNGLAVDPEGRRVYWADIGGAIGFFDLFSGGGGQLDTTGTSPVSAATPVLLKVPLALTTPRVTGRPQIGTTLSCESAWAPDLPESFLYRAPATVAYQWLRNGQSIAGATGTTLTARQAGSYACQSTATNAAGSAMASSSAVAIKAELTLGKVRLNRKAGTATLSVAALGVGKLALGGAGIKARRAKASEKARFRIGATGRAKKRLKATGRARVKATVTFRPEGAEPIRRSKTIVLRKAGVSRP